jgi:hypoxia up-regulated 1
MNPLAFISENTAAALFYGLDRLDNETQRIIFYNMGSSSLKVSLVEY